MSVSAGHPTNCLYFLLREPIREEVIQAFEEMLTSLPNRRSWVIGPPELVDYIDEYPSGNGVNQSVHTYGGAMRMYSALPPWGEKLPREVDVQHFEEVNLLVDELCRLSREFDCEFVLQLDRTPVGNIGQGKPDDFFRQGLLEEWKKGLGL